MKNDKIPFYNVFLAFVWIFLGSGSTWAASPLDWWKNYQGRSSYQQQNYPEAEKNFEQVINSDPEAEDFYNLGAAQYRQGKFSEAVASFSAALSTSDSQLKERAFYNLGNTYYRLEDLPRALQAYEEALKLSPQDEEAKLNYEFVKRKLEEKPQNSPPPSQQGEGEEKGEGSGQQGKPQQSGNEGQKDSKNSEAKGQGESSKQDSSASSQKDPIAKSPSQEASSEEKSPQSSQTTSSSQENSSQSDQKETKEDQQKENDKNSQSASDAKEGSASSKQEISNSASPQNAPAETSNTPSKEDAQQKDKKTAPGQNQGKSNPSQTSGNSLSRGDIESPKDLSGKLSASGKQPQSSQNNSQGKAEEEKTEIPEDLKETMKWLEMVEDQASEIRQEQIRRALGRSRTPEKDW